MGLNSMNNKKAFTLVELLAVISIISLISIILIPNIYKSSNRVKNSLYNTKKTSILKAYKMCKQDGYNDCISIKNLLIRKYVSKDNDSCTDNCLRNPKDNTYLDNCYVYGSDIICNVEGTNALEKINSFSEGEDAEIIDVITKTSPDASCTNTLAFDGTGDNNLRYVGANPCNYVKFNNERWRIICIMNNSENAYGEKTARLKIVSANSLGKYNYDDKLDTSWSVSPLRNELNTDYLNTRSKEQTTTWVTNYTYNFSKGLKEYAQSMIENMVWNVGEVNTSRPEPYPIYSEEKGETLISKVGLFSPSDYPFATAGGDIVSRDVCLYMTSLSRYSRTTDWSNSNNSDCKFNDWIKNWTWTMSKASSGSPVCIIKAGESSTDGIIQSASPGSNLGVYPVVYLNPDVYITGGNGSYGDPYILNY